MLRIGLFSIRWPDDTVLEISVANSSHIPVLQPLGRAHAAEILGSVESGDEDRRALLAYSDDKNGLFEPLRLLEETNYELVITAPFGLAEALLLREQSAIRQWPFLNAGLGPHLQILSPRLWKDAKGRALISAFFNPKGYAGVVDLSILDDRHRIAAEVVSGKLGYEHEYKQLLADVGEHHIQLVYEIGAVSGTRLKPSAEAIPDLPTALFHLRRLMSSDEIPAAVETILASPLATLASVESPTSRQGASQPDPAFLSARANQMGFHPGGALSGLFRGFTPSRIPQRIKRETLDNAENRYVKGFLYGLAELLVALIEACIADERWITAEEVERWLEAVYEWIDNGIWHEVGDLSATPENSQRLQKSAGYRDILRADIELRDALVLPWDEPREADEPLLGDVKPVSALYEYWCYFKVRSILKQFYGADVTGGQRMVFQSPGGLSMRLTESAGGRGSIFKENLPEGTTLHLFFNRRFRPTAEEGWGTWSGSYSVSFDPDISIAVKTPAATHWLNFDAKYRLERFQWDDAAQLAISDDTSTRQLLAYRQEDLNKMHCYRDAILGTRGAYVLYPGQTTENPAPFLRRAGMPRRGFSFPSVGAFPLRPGSEEQRSALKAFIRNSVADLIAIGYYQEEDGPQPGPRAVVPGDGE
jgi:predicted component of viral defense system (DUF524 family)